MEFMIYLGYSGFGLFGGEFVFVILFLSELVVEKESLFFDVVGNKLMIKCVCVFKF